MSPSAIPELVDTKLNHPDSFVVLASLVNSVTMGWVQHRLGAVYSYLPEPRPPTLAPSSQDTGDDSYGPKAWRASALPTWQSPDGEGKFEEFPLKPNWNKAPVGADAGPPYANHRWLPLRDEDYYIAETPIAHAQYAPFGPSLQQWAIAAQQHYSLLENIEKGLISKYYIGDDGIWNMRYHRGNINLIAICANDILDNLPLHSNSSDEEWLSRTFPEKLHRRTCIPNQNPRRTEH